MTPVHCLWSISRGQRSFIQRRVPASSARSLSHEINQASDASKAKAVAATDPTKKSQDDSPNSSLTNSLKYVQGVLEESSGLVEISHLKIAVQEASDKFDRATQQVAEGRLKVVEAQKAHDQAHKRHVSLLMRREEWGPEDAQSFVTITTDEVNTRQALLDAQEYLKRSEDQAAQCQHAYMDVMRQRYHEEQLWQDKWRLLGTYGTWSLIGINTMVFLLGQYRLEKRERARLQHMEQLVTKSQQQSQMLPVEIVEENENENEATVREEAPDSSQDTPDPAKENQEMPPPNKDFWGFPIHTPSVALGAAITASGLILVSLLRGR